MEQKLEALYMEYSDRVYHYILMMVGNAETAEDLTHDTFVRAHRSLHTFRGDASEYTWLLMIARNIVYDFWRRKRKIKFLPIKSYHSPAETNTPHDIVQKGETVTELYTAIKKLKLAYQEVLILRKIQELSVAETADTLGWSESKVKSTHQRAWNALKEELEAMQKEGGVMNEQSV